MGDPVIRGIFAGLVHRAGGVDTVAAILQAKFGTASKGTVSKMCSGQIGVTYDAGCAVEDFLDEYPLTNRMFERKQEKRDFHACLKELAAGSSVASGEAHASLIRAFSNLSEDPEALTEKERTDVIAAARAARQYWTKIIDAAEAAE